MPPYNGLSELPLELLGMISTKLHPQDVKTLRATSKNMQIVVLPYLITKAYIALCPGTMALFNKIVAHPVFSKSVKEVVFDASLLLANHDVFEQRTVEDDGQRMQMDGEQCSPEYERL